MSKNMEKYPTRFKKGHRHSLESRLKMSESHKGKVISLEVRKKISEALKGKIPKNISFLHSKEVRKIAAKAISMAKKGKPLIIPLSKEQKEQRRLRMMGDRNIAKKPEIREKLKGKNNFRWKGGITPINLSIRKSFEYKEWRRAVYKRDNYTCMWCGIRGNQTGGYLQADHIKPFALFPELRFAIDNGRTLCKKCHLTTSTYGNRGKTK